MMFPPLKHPLEGADEPGEPADGAASDSAAPDSAAAAGKPPHDGAFAETAPSSPAAAPADVPRREQPEPAQPPAEYPVDSGDAARDEAHAAVPVARDAGEVGGTTDDEGADHERPEGADDEIDEDDFDDDELEELNDRIDPEDLDDFEELVERDAPAEAAGIGATVDAGTPGAALAAGDIPMLTEVVQVPRYDTEDLPQTLAAVDWGELGQRVRENVLERLLRRSDALLDAQLQNTLTPVLERAAEAVAHELHDALNRMIREIVARAVTEELTRLHAEIAKRNRSSRPS